MEKLKVLVIGKKRYPIKMNNYVLEAIQEEYGTVNAFEKMLVGIEETETENGEVIRKRVEPSIKAINFVLPLMIKEGIRLDAFNKEKYPDEIDDYEIISSVDISFWELANILHEEMNRCFHSKKNQPKRKKNLSRLISFGQSLLVRKSDIQKKK